MRYFLIAVLLSGCCSHPDYRPALTALRATVATIRKRAERDGGTVKITAALKARLVTAEELADKALELSE